MTLSSNGIIVKLYGTFIELRKGRRRLVVKFEEIKSLRRLDSRRIKIVRRLKRDVVLQLSPEDSEKFTNLAEESLTKYRHEKIVPGVAAHKELRKVEEMSREVRALVLPGPGQIWQGFAALEAARRQIEREKKRRPR